MKKSFYALTLAAFSLPAIAQDAQLAEQPVVAQDPQAIEQPAFEDAVANQEQSPGDQQESAAQSELTSSADQEATASFEQPATEEATASFEQHGSEEFVTADGEFSTELAGTEHAGNSARGTLNRRLAIGGGVAAGVLLYSVLSNDDGGNGSAPVAPGPTGTH